MAHFLLKVFPILIGGGGKGVPASAGTAGGWVFGAGKCRGIAIWVPANAGLRKHF